MKLNTKQQDFEDREFEAAKCCANLMGRAILLAVEPLPHCGIKDFERHIKFAKHSKFIDHLAGVIEIDPKRMKDKIIEVNTRLLIKKLDDYI